MRFENFAEAAECSRISTYTRVCEEETHLDNHDIRRLDIEF